MFVCPSSAIYTASRVTSMPAKRYLSVNNQLCTICAKIILLHAYKSMPYTSIKRHYCTLYIILAHKNSLSLNDCFVYTTGYFIVCT